MATKRTFEQNLALAKARGTAAKKAAAKKAPAAKQLSLEFWPDAVRGVPNPVLRGALFGVSQKRKTHKKRTVIAAVDGYEIRFKGETFNQTDLDTLQGMLHLARPHPLGTRVEFSVHSFLKELGRGTGKEQHEQFKEQVMRLVTGGIEITSLEDKKTFMGTLVHKAFRDEATGRYVVIFDEDMLNLYQTGHTLIDWEQRQALGKNNLAKWLQGFYASHAKPFPYKVQTIFNLCGSTTERLGDFRKLLRTALAQLVDVGAIASWEIEPKTDLVKVVNIPSQSQLKHLTKALKRA
jgi:TrfA protein